MNCRRARAQHTAAAEGRLQEAERQAYEAHLSGCARCRQEVAQMLAAVQALRGLSRERVPAGLASAVAGRLASRPQRWVPAYVWASAGVVLVAVMLGYLLLVVSPSRMVRYEAARVAAPRGEARKEGKRGTIRVEKAGRGAVVPPAEDQMRVLRGAPGVEEEQALAGKKRAKAVPPRDLRARRAVPLEPGAAPEGAPRAVAPYVEAPAAGPRALEIPPGREAGAGVSRAAELAPGAPGPALELLDLSKETAEAEAKTRAAGAAAAGYPKYAGAPPPSMPAVAYPAPRGIWLEDTAPGEPPLVHVDVREAAVAELLREISAKTGTEIALREKTDVKVTLHAAGTPTQVVQAVCDVAALGLAREGDTLIVGAETARAAAREH